MPPKKLFSYPRQRRHPPAASTHPPPASSSDPAPPSTLTESDHPPLATCSGSPFPPLPNREKSCKAKSQGCQNGAFGKLSFVFVGRVQYKNLRQFSSKPPVFGRGQNDRFDDPEKAHYLVSPDFLPPATCVIFPRDTGKMAEPRISTPCDVRFFQHGKWPF